MPELPEVEHARGLLQTWLRGATITGVTVPDPRILDPGAKPGAIVAALTDRRVAGVDRRGKWLRIRLERGLLFSHLGMTGRWVRPLGADEVRFAKVELAVARRGATRRVVYADPRLFGRFVVAERDIEAWSELGPDPLHDGIEAAALAERFARRRTPVKVALLDQTVLAGVGNIQATEALFFARIDPRRPASSLSRREVGALARGILRSIEETFAAQDAELTYVNEPGSDNPFTIYGREGTPCPRCKRPLAKLVLAGRGTVLCGACQR
jgi:formamidopyrimidine-DNA glycosylase